MAIAGGVTAAYRCQVVDGWLRVKYSPMPRGHCADTVEQAVELLRNGHQVIVAGADMAALRTALAGSGVGTAGG